MTMQMYVEILFGAIFLTEFNSELTLN